MHRHGVNSGGDTVTSDPPRKWMCVATGVDEPEASGDFSPLVVCSGIAESLLGDILSSGDARLFAFPFVADICARGLLSDLRELVFKSGRGDLCAYS